MGLLLWLAAGSFTWLRQLRLAARWALFRGTPFEDRGAKERGENGGNLSLYTFIGAATAWHGAAVPPLSSMPLPPPSQARSRRAAWARFSAPLCPWSEVLGWSLGRSLKGACQDARRRVPA